VVINSKTRVHNGRLGFTASCSVFILMDYCIYWNIVMSFFMDEFFIGILAYEDNLMLLAPTPSSLSKLLTIFESYALKFDAFLMV
jgi:hypothetical protein